MCEIRLEREGSLFRDFTQSPFPPGGYKYYFKLHNEGTTPAQFDSDAITADAVSPFIMTVSPANSFSINPNQFQWITVHLTGIVGTVEYSPATYGITVNAVSQSCGSTRDGILLGAQV